MTTPAIDFNAICVALAARFVAGTIGTPTGAVAMRQSLAQSPKAINTDGPVHLLEVTDGSVIAAAGQWKHGGATNYTVDKAIPTGWLWDEFRVGNDDWDAIRVHWALFVTENVTLTP